MWARTTSSAPISIGSATSSSPSHAGRATSRVGGASATSSLAARPQSRTWSRTDPRKAAENLPEGLDTPAAFLGQTSQKFGRLRLAPKPGLSAELLGPRPKTCLAFRIAAASLGTVSHKKFGRLRPPPKSGLSAELLGCRSRQAHAAETTADHLTAADRGHTEQQMEDLDHPVGATRQQTVLRDAQDKRNEPDQRYTGRHTDRHAGLYGEH